MNIIILQAVIIYKLHTSEIRDLGVVIDTELKFHAHTTTIVNKVNRLLGIISSPFRFFSLPL